MLIIWKSVAAEDEHAPEFQFLLSVTVARAREVFSDVALCTEARLPAIDYDYVLRLGREHVWLTADTLRRMKATIDAGADRAEPARLSDCALEGLDPLYTARDFDQLARRVLDEDRLPRSGDSSSAPVSVPVSVPVPIPVCLYSPAGLDTQTRGSGPIVRNAGVMHQFSDYYGETRADLLPYLPPTAEEVLEIGCGRGRTGQLLQNVLGCRVTGVEQNPAIAAEAAVILSRVIVGDVLTVPIEGRYDAIVASEVAEHLADLDRFLLRMKTLLKPAGRIVLSVPNVGHYSIVEDLLAGRWDYVPAGLLCYTHLRFFTRQTLMDWMTRLGFVCTITPQVTDLPERFADLPATFACDRDSLRTAGFYVVLEL